MANRPAVVREAELTRILRAARKAGVHVQADFKPDGEISVSMVASPAKTIGASLADEMFG